MLISSTLKHLLALLADGQFHSGTQLANAAGVSRAAVWKQLRSLAALGIELNAVSGKGYKLSQAMQLLDGELITGALRPYPKSLLAALDVHDALDSTNNYLLDRARLGGVSGHACICEFQSAGRGRRGRQWLSPFGQNIYLSILWRYHDSPAAIAGLSLALGVAVIKALRDLGVKECGLKWPNDIYWRQRKLGGILVEVVGESGGPCHAVIGLGLNFYLSAQDLACIDQPCADMAGILGKAAYQRRNELIALLLNHLLPLLAEFKAHEMPKYAAEWRLYDCMQGKAADLYIAEQCYSGIVAGIDDNGLLLLNTDDGQQRGFAAGEVSFRTL
ncbi:MAG: bifunctional biotin--[acetyl-CoA-carboxylase] ligase/biotin operon repressor BirA [Methylomonas sp.]|jgi:BirA family biotin operon repressor/biotin-[acetyl-CoA-carboxylase] ligase